VEVCVVSWKSRTGREDDDDDDVGCGNVVFYRGVENQCGADNRSWKHTEDAASSLDVSAGRHIALAKPSIR